MVNWNGGENLRRSVDSLLAQTRRPARILVMDNASSDNSLDALTDLGDAIEIHRLDRNTGFAAANNLAIRKVSDCEWVALLNPDAFAEPDWLAQLLAAAVTHPEFSFFATRMLNHADPDVLDGAGDGYHFSGWPGRRGHGLKAAGRYLKLEEVFAPCAAAALYRREAVMTAGGFDEAFFCYIEDVDLGFRLRLCGHRCLYVPTAVVRHVGAGTTGKGSDAAIYYGHRNLVWSFFKNMPLPLLAVLLLPHLLMNIVAVAWFVARGRGRIILAAKRDAIVGFRRILKQRDRAAHRKRLGTAIAATLSFWPYR
ncbi:MAG: glycosyltransferase family 2 protein [Gammaproteobacteria bacterium]